MKARKTIYILALTGLSSLAASAQAPSAAIIPAIASIPLIARMATAKKLPMTECDGQVLVHTNNAIVCAIPETDWANLNEKGGLTGLPISRSPATCRLPDYAESSLTTFLLPSI